MSRSLRTLTSFLALLVTTFAVLSGGAVARAADGAGATSWSVRTALSKYGSDRPRFTYTVKSGEQLTDGIDIANRGAAPISLRIYAADGFTTETGGFDLLTPDKRSTAVGAWVKPSTDRVTIPAGQQVQIPFTMTVPADATPGDHLGGIVTVLDQPDASGSRTVIHRRVGLRILARVSGTLTSRLRVERLTVEHPGGNPFGSALTTVSYTVRNTGNTVLGGLQKVRVAGALGLSARTVDAPRLPDLLPGESWPVKVSVADVRAVLWLSATVTVTPVRTDAAGSTTTLSPVAATHRTLVSVWSVVILVVALLGVPWFLLRSVRWWRLAARAKVDAKVASAVQQALKENARV